MIDYVWGVVDFIPKTDFPDFRNRAIIITQNGTRMLIPRESNKIRVYVQLDGLGSTNTATCESIMEVRSSHLLL